MPVPARHEEHEGHGARRSHEMDISTRRRDVTPFIASGAQKPRSSGLRFAADGAAFGGLVVGVGVGAGASCGGASVGAAVTGGGRVAGGWSTFGVVVMGADVVGVDDELAPVVARSSPTRVPTKIPIASAPTSRTTDDAATVARGSLERGRGGSGIDTGAA